MVAGCGAMELSGSVDYEEIKTSNTEDDDHHKPRHPSAFPSSLSSPTSPRPHRKSSIDGFEDDSGNGHDSIVENITHPSSSSGASLSATTEAKLGDTIKVIEDALSTFGVDHIALSFNGGKDCTLLLQVVWDVIVNKTGIDLLKHPIKAVYITPEHAFEEVDEFVTECVVRYNLSLERIPGPLKKGLRSYLDHHPSVHAMFIGVREADPHSSELRVVQPTDPSWPAFTRIHPILYWNYREVWEYLNERKIRTCVLYARGYTSLGGTDTTIPNPKLKMPDTDGAEDMGCHYRPAWELSEMGAERLGRLSTPLGSRVRSSRTPN